MGRCVESELDVRLEGLFIYLSLCKEFLSFLVYEKFYSFHPVSASILFILFSACIPNSSSIFPSTPMRGVTMFTNIVKVVEPGVEDPEPSTELHTLVFRF